MRKDIIMNYIIDDNEITCEYINRLKESLESNNELNNINTIEKKLESIIEEEIKDIHIILNRLEHNIKLLYNNFYSIKDTYMIARVLAKDFENYGKKLLMYNQITTITFEGLDERRYS